MPADAGSVAGHTGGESETIIGEWLESRRNRDGVVIAAKGRVVPGRVAGLCTGARWATACACGVPALLSFMTVTAGLAAWW